MPQLPLDVAWPAPRAQRGPLGVLRSPNQVLTHAARAAAKPFQPPLVAAREGLWLEQRFAQRETMPQPAARRLAL